jgi:hypothetical protein
MDGAHWEHVAELVCIAKLVHVAELVCIAALVHIVEWVHVAGCMLKFLCFGLLQWPFIDVLRLSSWR